MPRKEYKLKNPLCRNTNLSELQVRQIIWYYIQCSSAPEAHKRMLSDETVTAPSVKTIGNFYRRLGDYLFWKVFEPFLLKFVPEILPIKKHNPDAYQSLLDVLVDRFVKFHLANLDYNSYRAIAEDVMRAHISTDYHVDFRKVVGARQGIKKSQRGDLALAFVRCVTARHFARDKDEFFQINFLQLNIVSWLQDDPL